MPPHCKFDHEIHVENDQMPPHSHIYLLSGTELGLLHEFLMTLLSKRFIQLSQLPGQCTHSLCEEEGWHPATLCQLLKPQRDQHRRIDA